MKFHFIRAHRQSFRLGSLCRVLGVSRSGYYAWHGRPLPRRDQRNQALLLRIRQAYETGRRAYGSPRVHRELLGAGVRCGRHRIARLMRLEGIVACTEKRFRWTANKRDEIPAAPNLLQRRFQVAEPNRTWVSDITYLRTGQGWLHLAIVLDLFSRRIVGWAMHANLTQELVLEAIEMALADRKPEPGLLFHSDRGGQYLSSSVQELMDRNGIVSSTNRPGNCLDNAVAESFFHTLKTELFYHRHYRTREEARLDVFDFIAAFYNRTRLHSTLGYHSPEEYERLHSVS
jgi:transposase InsO family protein